jgi:prophage antirepressor-like protein
MSQAITVFAFRQSKVRTAGSLEAPLFCASDVCAALGIANIGNALSRLAQTDIEHIRTADVIGKNREIAFVTEAGLYKLVMRSRTAQAEPFVDWVAREVLPEIRRRGYYDAVEVATRKQTEQLLAEAFPKLPSKSKPIFSGLIAALLTLRRERGRAGNPPWARSLASSLYGWTVKIPGQQQARRARNGKHNGSATDYSMFSEPASEGLKQVIAAGTAFARISQSWADWRMKMELAFGTKALQLPFMVPMLESPKRPKKDDDGGSK